MTTKGPTGPAGGVGCIGQTGPTNDQLATIIEEAVAEEENRQVIDDMRTWPEALRKAVEEKFQYAAEVRKLGIVEFSSAEWAGLGWVRLDFDPDVDLENEGLPYEFPRGLEVRVADIVWVCDAPRGD